MPPHSACPSEEKQTNKQKLSTNLTLYKLTQSTGSTLGGQKPKGRKNSILKTWKRRPQTQWVKKNNEKAEKYYTNEGTRNTEVQINEEEISDLPEKEFRIMIVKMIKNRINSRISEVEKQISELEDKMVEITSKEQNKVKRMKRTEDSLRGLWNNIKCTNI